MGIVLSAGGGWAGCTMASLETYLEISARFIPKDLIDEINKLLEYVNPYSELPFMYDETYLNIQFLASNVFLQLKRHLIDYQYRRKAEEAEWMREKPGKITQTYWDQVVAVAGDAAVV